MISCNLALRGKRGKNAHCSSGYSLNRTTTAHLPGPSGWHSILHRQEAGGSTSPSTRFALVFMTSIASSRSLRSEIKSLSARSLVIFSQRSGLGNATFSFPFQGFTPQVLELLNVRGAMDEQVWAIASCLDSNLCSQGFDCAPKSLGRDHNKIDLAPLVGPNLEVMAWMR
jgi:hypothetical protein